MRLAVFSCLLALSFPTCGSKTDTTTEEAKTAETPATKGLIPWKGSTGEREAALAARTKAFIEERKHFVTRQDAFEKERTEFNQERREALVALQEKKDLIRREEKLAERHKRIDLMVVGTATGACLFIVLSWIGFYFLLAGPLGRKIAATIVAQNVGGPSKEG